MHASGESSPRSSQALAQVVITELGNVNGEVEAAASVLEAGNSADTAEPDGIATMRKDQCRPQDRECIESESESDNRPLSSLFCQTYSYLCALTTEHLRNLSSRHRLPQGFCQNLQIAKIFMFVYNRFMREGASTGELLKEKEGWLYDEFLKQWPRIRQCCVMPSLGHIRKTAEALKREDAPSEHASVQLKFRLKRPRSRVLSGAKSGGSGSRQPLGAAAGDGSSWKRKATDSARDAGPAKRAATREKGAEYRHQEKFQTSEGKPKPPFSDSEFALLFVILRFDQEVRAAFDRSGQVKDKDQQSRGEKSRDFWDVHVEPTFNDHNEKPTFSCDEVVPGTDPSLPPNVKRRG